MLNSERGNSWCFLNNKNLNMITYSKQKMAKKEIGGQAVIEGVMLADKENVVIAVRKGKKIKIKKEKRRSLAKKYKLLKWPFFRGFAALIEMLNVGLRALSWSANEAAGEEEEITKKDFVFVIISAILLSLGLFVALPFFLTKLFSKDTGIVFNLIDGLFRILIFILYVLIISRFKDVRVLFQFHGAEHKVVNCYEDGKRVNLKNAREYSTLHARCGTSFLIIVLVVSIIVFSFIVDPRWYVKLLGRIVLIPVIAGVSYEVLKLSARFKSNIICRILIAPGLFIQRLTTGEPDDKQLEVAVRALEEITK